ncbi:hypothetical protein FLAG1_09333 [Fusarium langsethiae]|uniref:Secreted LysM effector LysM C-terminal domain-containing protein n=1 Tax=Fusarium langsethiae TaxID=179993 RepID=A0A0N0DC79_FUSLA|nr:hypothetical protein FLAG1_09333 [Fusarium langsethiae]GKU22880.1 unnamed protein product [Fusarium langsethiae]
MRQTINSLSRRAGRKRLCYMNILSSFETMNLGRTTATLYTDSICLADGDTQYRIISGDVDGGCNVLGLDMPGTSCDKFTNGGVNKGAFDGEEFQPWSILVQPDTACIVYADEHCDVGGDLVYLKDNIPTCKGYSAGIGFGISNIKSFACTASSNLKGSGIPGFE